MGFMDEVSSGGGAKLLRFDGRAGNYVVRGSDDTFNNQEFVASIYEAKGGYLKFGEKGQAPERHLGSIFPKDEAPLRSVVVGGGAGRKDTATPTFIIAMQAALATAGEPFQPDGKPEVRGVAEDQVAKVSPSDDSRTNIRGSERKPEPSEQALAHLFDVAGSAQSPPWQRPAKGDGRACARLRRRSGHRRQCAGA